MGVYQELINHDDVFNYGLKHVPIIVNDVDAATEVDMLKFRSKICTQYTTDIDLLNNLPSCECGSITGTDNLDIHCRICDTKVTTALDQELLPLVWIRKPIGITKLINPVVWIMLSNWFTSSKFNIIAWYCDTRYAPAVKEPPVMKRVRALGFERGYNNFINNFDEIIHALFQLREFRVKRVVSYDDSTEDDEGNKIDKVEFVNINQFSEPELLTLIKNNRNCIFTDYLPLPNRSLLVMEDTNLGSYVDPIIPQLIDSIMSFVGIDKVTARKLKVATENAEIVALREMSENNRKVTLRTIENRTAKGLVSLAAFYENFCSTTVAKKEGIYRKHIFASRCEFSGRAVIISITEPHHYRDMHISWGIAITMLTPHLINKLYVRGYTPIQAFDLLNSYATRFHPLISELFKELIAESKYQGIPAILQRNPSLERGSVQLLYITKVYDDPSVPTIAFSILNVVGYNADRLF